MMYNDAWYAGSLSCPQMQWRAFVSICMRQSLRCFDFKHKIINSISFDFRKVRQTFAYIDLRTVCGHPIGLEHSVCDDIPGVRMRAGARQSPLQLQKRLMTALLQYTQGSYIVTGKSFFITHKCWPHESDVLSSWWLWPNVSVYLLYSELWENDNINTFVYCVSILVLYRIIHEGLLPMYTSSCMHAKI